MSDQRLRRVIAAVVLSTSMLLPATAWPDKQKVRFVAAKATSFGARVRAEIEAMGFDVEPADTLDDRGTLTPIAAARVVDVPPLRHVELWLVDASSGRREL